MPEEKDNEIKRPTIQGGPHLAEMRNWIQWNAINGSNVMWCSQDIVQIKPVSVIELEELAQKIYDAARKEMIEELKRGVRLLGGER